MAESLLYQCFYVMDPREFEMASNVHDDVFLREFEYDVHWHNFKRHSETDNGEGDVEESYNDENWNSQNTAYSDKDDDMENEEEDGTDSRMGLFKVHQ